MLLHSFQTLYKFDFPCHPVLKRRIRHPMLSPLFLNQRKLFPAAGPWLNSGRRSFRCGDMRGCHCARKVIAVHLISSRLLSLVRLQYVPHMSQQLAADRIIVDRQTLQNVVSARGWMDRCFEGNVRLILAFGTEEPRGEGDDADDHNADDDAPADVAVSRALIVSTNSAIVTRLPF